MAVTFWHDKNVVYPKKFVKSKYVWDEDYTKDLTNRMQEDIKYYRDEDLKYDDPKYVNTTMGMNLDAYNDRYVLSLRADVSIPYNEMSPTAVKLAIDQLRKKVEEFIKKEIIEHTSMVIEDEEPLYGKGIPTILEENMDHGKDKIIKDLTVTPVDTKQLDYEKFIKENRNAVTS